MFAGRRFDLTQSYATEVMIAGTANLAGILAALGLPSQRTKRAELAAAGVGVDDVTGSVRARVDARELIDQPERRKEVSV